MCVRKSDLRGLTEVLYKYKQPSFDGLAQACQIHFGNRAKFFENRIQNFFTCHTKILFLGSNFSVHFDFTKDLLSM